MRALPVVAVLLALGAGPAIAAGPDFEVSSITLIPASPTAYGAYKAEIVVSNIGTASGDAGYLAYIPGYLRPPTSCYNPDSLGLDWKGWKAVTVGTLCGGTLCRFGTKSKKITVDLTAGAAGTKTFAAVADATCKTTEASEKNNAKTLSYSIVSPPGPDFIVQSVVLTPTAPVENDSFTATVTVKNQGTDAGDGGMLDVWVNNAASQSCPAAGEAQQLVGTLDAGATVVLEFPGLPAGAAGNKTFSAFVDSQCGTAEPLETNNQTTKSYTVSGGQPPSGADFIVQSITLDPASPPEYGAYTATVVVKNQGAVAGDGGSLDVWDHWPEAPLPGCGEMGMAQQAVGTLDPGATKSLTFTDLFAAEAGARTFRAFVDSQCAAAEDDEANNQSVLSYTVGGGGGGGDLPGAFTKVSPAAGAVEQPVSVPLVWDTSSGAESYEYCFDTTADNACDNGNWVSTGTEKVAIVAGLVGSTRYSWQVRALNAAGLTEADGGTWASFATQKGIPIFKETFGHPGVLQDPDWSVLSGLWILGGGWYRAFSPELINLARVKRFDPERKPLAGAVVQAKVMLSRGDGSSGNAMVAFHIRDRARYRYVKLTRSGVTVGQAGSFGNVGPGDKKTFARRLSSDAWYTLKVYVYPTGRVRVKLNNAWVGEYKFRSGVPGGVGLCAVRARSVADTYTIWGSAALP